MNLARLGMLWEHLKALNDTEFDMRFVAKCVAGHTCKMMDQYPREEPRNIEQTDVVIRTASLILDLDRLQTMDLFYSPTGSDTSLDSAVATVSTTYLWAMNHPLEYATFDWKPLE